MAPEPQASVSPRWITTSELIHIIRKPNLIIVLLIIQNISKILTNLLPRRLFSRHIFRIYRDI